MTKYRYVYYNLIMQCSELLSQNIYYIFIGITFTLIVKIYECSLTIKKIKYFHAMPFSD